MLQNNPLKQSDAKEYRIFLTRALIQEIQYVTSKYIIFLPKTPLNTPEHAYFQKLEENKLCRIFFLLILCPFLPNILLKKHFF